MPNHRNTPEVFWSRVNKTAGCWLWTANVMSNGYGRIFYESAMWPAHRLAWVLTNGPIPEGPNVNICHHCDVALCVRPEHLYVGTVKSNAQDRHRRGRANTLFGEAHPASRLTLADVIAIRLRVARGERRRLVADAYGISTNHVSNIVRGERWGHTHHG